MLKSRWLLALPLAGALVLPAAAQNTGSKKTTGGTATPTTAGASVDLKWKFQKGKAFYQEMTTKTDQKIKVMQQDIPQTQTQTFYFSWTPEDVKNNVWTVQQKIDGVKMDISVGGNPITFDSTKPAPASPNPLSDFFKQLVGSSFTLTVDPSKPKPVLSIKGREDFLKKLRAANPQMEPLLNVILSDDSLKQMADPAFSVVPDHAVKVGDTWKRQATLNMGPIGSYQTTYIYKYEGPDSSNKDLAKISVTTELKYSPPAAGGAAAAAALPFKITKADLKSDKSTGTILFDMKKGRVQSSTTHLELKGTLEIEINGQNTPVTLEQKQDTTVKTSDTPYVTPPAAPAKK
ncbi:MAG TPA: DUF6263 family protein [Gemmataceae bacterium]|nr:DUF6263 family protein [Gemmataceae bacterium]